MKGAEKKWGELQVTTQVTGFRKRRWYTHENLGEEPLDLPPTDLQTTGYWLSLSEETVTICAKLEPGPTTRTTTDQIGARYGTGPCP